MKKSILIHLASGFEETEAVTIIDVLRRAALDVIVVSITGELKVAGAHHITIEADRLYENTDYNDAAMIILPGGMPGATNLKNHKGLSAQLLKFNSEQRRIGAICAAPMILGSLGILNGKKQFVIRDLNQNLQERSFWKRPLLLTEISLQGKESGQRLHFTGNSQDT